MIDKLRSIAVFAAVVDQGSFRGAAETLGLAPSRVSEIVSSLEAALDVTLLYRTTRQLSLTHEGRLLHENAQNMLAAAETGLDAVNPSANVPTGSLRVTAPAFIAHTQLMRTFAKFMEAYPRVDISFHFSDHRSDIIRDGFDVAIRSGWLEDSELMTRKIGHTERYLVASPKYVASQSSPKAPSDLEDWSWIRFEMRANNTDVTTADGTVESVVGTSRVTVNSAEALYEFAVLGLGVTAIPEHLARRGFASGDLVQVLPHCRIKPLGLYAVWPNQTRRENLTTLFVRFMAGDV